MIVYIESLKTGLASIGAKKEFLTGKLAQETVGAEKCTGFFVARKGSSGTAVLVHSVASYFVEAPHEFVNLVGTLLINRFGTFTGGVC